jgi:hypothetical protein
LPIFWTLPSELVKECLYREHHPHVDLWDDHVTAFRALALCKAWNALRANEDAADSLMQDLAYALVRHARKLALKAFYRLTAQPRGDSRLRVVCDWPHPPDLSPSERVDGPRPLSVAFSPTFVERLAAMLDAGRLLLKPDGRLPALGDTQADSPVLVSAFASELARSTLFKDGGYTVLRTGRVSSERVSDERFLVARLATFDTSHIHRDVLSFELYGGGTRARRRRCRTRG